MAVDDTEELDEPGGTGHEERVPLPSPDGLGYLCRSCWQSVKRRCRASAYLPTRWAIV